MTERDREGHWDRVKDKDTPKDGDEGRLDA